jgi:hypothetical protein
MNLALIISLINFAFFIVLIFYIRWYVKQRTGLNPQLEEYKEEVQRLIAEIDHVTDRDSLLVEERIKELKEVLADIEKRINVLLKERDKTLVNENYRLFMNNKNLFQEQLLSSGQSVDSVLSVPKETSSKEKTNVKDSFSYEKVKKPVNLSIQEKIYNLHKKGLSTMKIASKLKISITEAEIALNLSNIDS